jgi:hypothetical protein
LEQKSIDVTREPYFVGIEFVDKWFPTNTAAGSEGMNITEKARVWVRDFLCRDGVFRVRWSSARLPCAGAIRFVSHWLKRPGSGLSDRVFVSISAPEIPWAAYKLVNVAKAANEH